MIELKKMRNRNFRTFGWVQDPSDFNSLYNVVSIFDNTSEMYKELVNEYGETKAKKCIEELSLYKKSKGVEYKSDFATIKRWVVARVEEIEERQEKRSNNKKKSNRFNYEQRRTRYLPYAF